MPTTRLSTLLPRGKSGTEISHRRAEGIFLKLSLGGLFGFVLLIALIWGGHRFYVRWQEKRLIHKAETALREGDTPSASLAVRAVLQIKPDSLPAERIAATMATSAGDSSALVWWRKIVETKGHSAEDVLALAQTALQFNDPATARTAVAGLSEADRQSAGYHALAGVIAQAEKENNNAIVEWEQAVRLSPEEKAYQLQLGAAEFRSNDRSRRESGEALLNALRSDAKYRTAATRILIIESVAQHQSVEK